MEVGTVDGVLRSLSEVLTFLYKKRHEAQAVLDYLSDRITGNELQRVLREAVRRGDRERQGSFVDTPWTRSEGARKAIEFSTEHAGRKPTIGQDVKAEIVSYRDSGTSQLDIARMMGFSRGMVRRAIARWERAK